jgi:hypothetical protein
MKHPYYLIRPAGQLEQLAQTPAEAWYTARILATIHEVDTAIHRADAVGPLTHELTAHPMWSHSDFYRIEALAECLAEFLADDVVIIARGRLFDVMRADDVRVNLLAGIGARYVRLVCPLPAPEC